MDKRITETFERVQKHKTAKFFNLVGDASFQVSGGVPVRTSTLKSGSARDTRSDMRVKMCLKFWV